MAQIQSAGEHLESLLNVKCRANDVRFFHKMSEVPPYESAFPISTAPNVVPEAFGKAWEERIDEWGIHMKEAYVLRFTSLA